MGGYCSKPVTLVKDVEIGDVVQNKVYVTLDGSQKEVFHSVKDGSKYKKGDRVDVWIDEWRQPGSFAGEGWVGRTRGGRYLIGVVQCKSSELATTVTSSLVALALAVAVITTGTTTAAIALAVLFSCIAVLCIRPQLQTFFAKTLYDEHIVTKV